MGISLPFESGLNRYVTPELAFIFHYFFTRKFWMVYNTQALVCCPGGVGTCDELFELLTLKQTGKVPQDLPIVLLGKEFWNTVVNWQASWRKMVFSHELMSFCFRHWQITVSLLNATSMICLSPMM
jgi:predicted Rossmann-fold nucleotide-binding protein